MPSQPQSADCGNQFYCAVAIKPINQFELYTGGCMLCLSRRIPINAEQDISPSVHDKLFLSASTAEANTLWNQSSPFCLWLSLLKSKFLIGKAVFYFAHKDYSKHQYIHQFGMFFFLFFLGWRNTEAAVSWCNWFNYDFNISSFHHFLSIRHYL